MNMKKISIFKRRWLVMAISLGVCASIVAAQELVPVKDLTGGTSLFVFRGGSKSVSKRFVSQSTARRSRSQRAQTARRVSSQYTRLASNAPRRQRTTAIAEDKLPPIQTKSPQEVSILFAGVGEYYINEKNYERSIDFFREARTLDGTNTIARDGLSEALALRGNEMLTRYALAVAKKDFEEAISLNPKNGPAYYGLAEVLSAESDDDLATENYEKALSADSELTEIYVPLGILYYQRDNIAKADELLTKAVAIEPNDAQAQYFLGLVRLKQENGDAALAAFNKATANDATLAEAFYYTGETLTRLGRTRESIPEFQKAIALRQNYFEAHYGLGTAHFELDEFKEAVDEFEKAKLLKNDNPEVVANLGDAYRLMNDFNRAETNYNLAALFFEGQPDFATNQEKRELTADILGRAAFSVARQCEINTARGVPCKWSAAVRYLEKAKTLTTNNVDTSNLGWAYFNAARTDFAEKRDAEGRAKLQKAIENLTIASAANSPFQQGALLNLGRVYTETGDKKGAINALKRVVDKEPKWAFAQNELGIAYVNDNNFKEAIKHFKLAIRQDDKLAEAHLNLGLAEFKNGNTNEAKKAHSKLRSLGRDDLATRLTNMTGGVVKS